MGGETSSDRGRVILDTHAATSQKRLDETTVGFAHRDGMREKLLLFQEAFNGTAVGLEGVRCFQVLDK